MLGSRFHLSLLVGQSVKRNDRTKNDDGYVFVFSFSLPTEPYPHARPCCRNVSLGKVDEERRWTSLCQHRFHPICIQGSINREHSVFVDVTIWREQRDHLEDSIAPIDKKRKRGDVRITRSPSSITTKGPVNVAWFIPSFFSFRYNDIVVIRGREQPTLNELRYWKESAAGKS